MQPRLAVRCQVGQAHVYHHSHLHIEVARRISRGIVKYTGGGLKISVQKPRQAGMQHVTTLFIHNTNADKSTP